MDRRYTLKALFALSSVPLSLRAQNSVRLPRVALLVGGSSASDSTQLEVKALLETMRQLGWIDGRTVDIDHRWGEGKIDVMRTQAKLLLDAGPHVFVVSTASALREVQKITSKVPIVFWGVSDPVGNKFVLNLARPEGNITGFSLFDYSMAGKWLQFLKQAVPNLERVLVLMNAANPNLPGWLKAFDVISPKLGIEVVRPNLTDAAQIEPLISAFGGEPNGGVLVLPDPFFRGDYSLLGQLLVKYRLPSIAGLNAFAESGGLIAYSIDQMDLARRAAFYVNRILKGELPRNLPVQGPTQFELLINMKTARSLSLTLPQSLFVSVNRVIE